MITEPLFKNFSPKIEQFILVTMAILMYICVCAEADIYVPAFPQMIKYFNIAENQIQQVLGINFIGLCLAGAIVGPLADSFGRRIVILCGLAIFMLSSIALVTIDNFQVLLFWRFIQGLAAAVPMVCAAAMIVDKYSGEKSSQLIGMINAVITAAIAAAPVAGAYISEVFNWRANFIVVMLLSVITFIGFLLLVEESLAPKLKRPFKLKAILQDYLTVIKNLKFITYVLLACLPFITILVYITNLSVIFVNHLGMSLSIYSYYQASTMGSFVIFSLASIKIINKKGVNFTKNLGASLAFIGAMGLLLVSIIDHTSAIFICLAMAILAAGGSLMSGTFGMQALAIFPEMNGIALAACTVIRLFLISAFVALTEVFFDGTIMPVAIIIAGYTIFSMCLYGILELKK